MLKCNVPHFPYLVVDFAALFLYCIYSNNTDAQQRVSVSSECNHGISFEKYRKPSVKNETNLSKFKCGLDFRISTDARLI